LTSGGLILNFLGGHRGARNFTGSRPPAPPPLEPPLFSASEVNDRMALYKFDYYYYYCAVLASPSNVLRPIST